VQHFLDMHTSRFDALSARDAAQTAIKLLADTAQREALVLTHNDALMVPGLGFAAGLVLMPLVKNPRSAPHRRPPLTLAC
jgi:DHA2 family multidrug resistance protein